jgi:hypothetical protein
MIARSFTSKEILAQLDIFADRGGVPFFDNGQCYPIESQLCAYGNKENWGITLEQIIFSPAAGTIPRGGHQGIRTNIFSYGNGLRVKAGGNNIFGIVVTSDDQNVPTFLFEDIFDHEDPKSPLHADAWEHVNPNAKTMRIRDQVIPIETDPAAYEEMGIRLLDPPRIKGHELVRGLPLKFRRMLLSTESERQKKFLKRARCPLILQMDEWYHPKLSEGEYPSKSETFQMLAEVLVSGDRDRYQPTKLPNTHWSNWPKAGIFERPAE